MTVKATSVTGPPSSLVHQPVSILDRLELAALFQSAQPLEVELGSGDGSFLAQWAKLNPDRNFIGVERLLGRLRKLDRKARRAGLTNLRLIRLEAAYFIEFLLPRASVTTLHVYFPDPWPKRKHRRHRLVNEHFAAIAAQALASGGVIFLRTDDADYFAQMQSVFGAHRQFRSVATSAELSAVQTDFERGFGERGVPTLRAAYQLLA